MPCTLYQMSIRILSRSIQSSNAILNDKNHLTMKRILVIEDNPDMLDNIVEILELANYQVITAQDGKAGIALAREDHPDLILCDIMMPGIDGYGVLKILSVDPTTADIPFILLSAKSTKEDVRMGMDLGADDYLTKPFEEMELLNAIEGRLRFRERLSSQKEKQPDRPDRDAHWHFLYSETKAINQILSPDITGAPYHYKKGTTIFVEDAYPRYVYYVRQGTVKIYTTNLDGKEFVTGIAREGDFFGYKAMLQNTPYIDSAITLAKTELLQIKGDDFFNLIHRHRDVSFMFLKKLAFDVQENKVKLLSLAYDSTRMRVAQALLRLCDKTDSCEIRITRDNLAQIVGAASESVIRILGEFKTEGLISTTGRTIELHDVQGLKNVQ